MNKINAKYTKDTISFLGQTHKDIMELVSNPDLLHTFSLAEQALFVSSANGIASVIVAFQALEFSFSEETGLTTDSTDDDTLVS